MFVGAADAFIEVSCKKTVVAESGIFLMFPDLNPLSCHKTVERRHGRE